MSDLSLIPEAAWREAQRRAEVIRPLAERGSLPRHLVASSRAASRTTSTTCSRALRAAWT